MREVSEAFLHSKPAGLVSGSLKFLLFFSFLLSEATISAQSDMLAHVHLLGLSSSLPPSLSFSVISLLHSTLLSLWVRTTKFSCPSLVALCFPLCQPFLSFQHLDVIAINSPWRHRSRQSSLIFVSFHYLPTLFFFKSPSSPQCLLPLSPPKRIRWNSLVSLLLKSEMMKQTK